jgi:hypothetical protein
MENQLKAIEIKIHQNTRKEKAAWEYLSAEEREAWAEHLVGKKHYLNASRFTADSDKKAEYLRLYKERFGL